MNLFYDYFVRYSQRTILCQLDFSAVVSARALHGRRWLPRLRRTNSIRDGVD